MKAASSSEIKKALAGLEKKELIELNLRLARFKKENKELLTYLLFEENDPEAFLLSVKESIDHGFLEVNPASIYFAKKTLRKILRISNKFIRYTGSKEMEAAILLHYATNFRGLKLNWQKSTAMMNIYLGVLKKIEAAINTLHEDLQHDYQKELNRLII